jgi:hypothetical protein
MYDVDLIDPVSALFALQEKKGLFAAYVMVPLSRLPVDLIVLLPNGAD